MPKFDVLARKLLKDPRVKAGHEHAKDFEALGELLRMAREQRGMSQQQLHRQSGVQQAEISRLEAGRAARGPTVATLRRLARAQQMRLRISFVPIEAKETRSTKAKASTAAALKGLTLEL
jgi:transcriptional regulator with XRE-family HTH domain